MRQQRNLFQMKKQDKIPEEELGEDKEIWLGNSRGVLNKLKKDE